MNRESHITYKANELREDNPHDTERTGVTLSFNQEYAEGQMAVDLFTALSDTLVILLATPGPLEQDEAEADCRGFIICLACPRDWNDPPFLSFSMLSHIRLHLRRQPGHTLVMHCRDHEGKHHSVANLLRANGIHVARTTWGGARLGAGAPKGNLNALRTGTRTQDAAIREYMADLDVQNRLSAAIFLRQYKKGEQA